MGNRDINYLNDVSLVRLSVSDRVLFKYSLDQVSSDEHTHNWVSWLKTKGLSNIDVIHFLVSSGFLFFFFLFYLFFFFSAQAFLTRYDTLDGLNNRNIFSWNSEGWKSEIRRPAWLCSSESFPSGLKRSFLSVS